MYHTMKPSLQFHSSTSTIPQKRKNAHASTDTITSAHSPYDTHQLLLYFGYLRIWHLTPNISSYDRWTRLVLNLRGFEGRKEKLTSWSVFYLFWTTQSFRFPIISTMEWSSVWSNLKSHISNTEVCNHHVISKNTYNIPFNSYKHEYQCSP